MKFSLLIFFALLFSISRTSNAQTTVRMNREVIKGKKIEPTVVAVSKRTDQLAVRFADRDTSIDRQLTNIKKRLIETQDILVRNNKYPKFYKNVFSNYDKLLNKAYSISNDDSVAMIINYINKDLTLKSSSGKEDGVMEMKISLVELQVNAVREGTSEELEGFNVVLQPFFAADIQSAIIFNDKTKKAVMKVPPGWYKIIVDNGQGLKGEKPATIKFSQNSIPPFSVDVKLN